MSDQCPAERHRRWEGACVDLVVVVGAALGSAVLGAVAGTGGTAVLLPVLVQYFGIHAAVPMLTLANFAANLSRAWLYWRAVDRSVVAWFTLGSLPLTLLGTWLFTLVAPGVLTPALPHRRGRELAHTGARTMT